jgi:hypothetical protein
MRGAAASNLPDAMTPGADYFNTQWTPAALLGISSANQTKAAGQALPPVSVTGGDNAFVPWHPDSPDFWLVVIAGLTLLGLAGASVRVRAFKGSAGANIGET